jgi:hypothetical protein
MAKLNAYCGTCKAPRTSGYCAGSLDAPHDPEPCPPCSGCTRRVCNWSDEAGCARFSLNDKAAAHAIEKRK